MRAATVMRCAAIGAAIIAANGPAVARGAGWGIGEQSAVAGGTAGAGTARASNPAAAWYNPAALADGRGLSASVGLLIAAPSVDARGLDDDWQASTERNLRLPPHLYLGYSAGRLAFGLSANVPFGSGMRWPRTWSGRHESVVSSVTVFRLAPFAAWRFGPVRIAAGVQVDVALLSIERQLDFVDSEGHVAIDLDGVGLGGHASIYWQALEQLGLGLTYKSRVRTTLGGTARFDVPDAFVARAHDQRTSAAITLPDLLTVGARYEPHRQWALSVDVGVAFWSTLERIAIDFTDPATTDVELTPRWRTRPFVRGGAEFSPWSRLTARAGLLFDPSPAPEETLAPNSPDSDRFGVSFGLGVRLWRELSVDAFYTRLRLLGNASTSSEALAAEYEGQAHLLGIGLRLGR